MRIRSRQPEASRTIPVLIVGAILALNSVADPVFGQDETPLGDVARQSRKTQSSTRVETQSSAATTANQWASGIQQQQEEIGTTPDGFGTYIGPGYQVWIPAPFSVIGRNDDGTLLGSA